MRGRSGILPDEHAKAKDGILARIESGWPEGAEQIGRRN